MTMPYFDMELWLPGVSDPALGRGGRAGPAGPHRLPPEPGHGFPNYETVFTRWVDTAEESRYGTQPTSTAEYLERVDQLIEMMDAADVVGGALTTAPNEVLVEANSRYPGRFKSLVNLSPFDGMRAVRELERLTREGGIAGLQVFGLYDQIPASDRRFYPLYTKCAELDLPVRIYCSMTYANDRPFDLGHPRHVDQVASDFPELRIVAGLGGWPWVNEMVALVRRHPNLYVDTGSHHPKYLPAAGSGWEMLMRYGNTVLQDKVMAAYSWMSFGGSLQDIVDDYRQMPLKPEVLDKWMYGNAARFFDLPPLP